MAAALIELHRDWAGTREIAARGECEGAIANECRGSGGFGYDPVFLPAAVQAVSGVQPTMAELSSGEKDQISHRGQALKALAEKIGGKR